MLDLRGERSRRSALREIAATMKGAAEMRDRSF